jgi:hypothetical protein
MRETGPDSAQSARSSDVSPEEARARSRPCANCHHHRRPVRPNVFALTTSRAPGVLEERLKRLQQEREYAKQEEAAARQRKPFDYEPLTRDWCWAYTHLTASQVSEIVSVGEPGGSDQAHALLHKLLANAEKRVAAARDGDQQAQWELYESDKGIPDSATGKFVLFYELCQWWNPAHDCPLYDDKSQPCRVQPS